MAKFLLWPGNALDRLVAEFFVRKGIDHRDVSNYTLERNPTGLPTITLTMFYDEGPAPTEAPAPMPRLNTVSTENPNIVKEG